MAANALVLDDGRRVTLGERTPGGSKNHTSYGACSDGQQVVVKVQTVHGRLAQEATALVFARQHGVRVPDVVGCGHTRSGADGQFFLVLSREAGVRTAQPDGWYRLGRDLSSLAKVPVEGCPLARVSREEFALDHKMRLEVVEPILSASTASQVRIAIERVEAAGSLCLTHGDPGSGNYLDTGEVGVILDWEDATVSPYGMDAGRAAFIALLDNGRTARASELHAAVVDGYRDGLDGVETLDDELLAAWTVVAGLQFVHDRFVRPLRPDRTAQMAAEVLSSFLDRL